MTYKQTYDIVRTGSQITEGGKHVREDFLRQIQIRRNADLRSVSDMIVSHGTVCADIDSGGGLHKDWDLSQAAVGIWIGQVRSGGADVLCEKERKGDICPAAAMFLLHNPQISRLQGISWGALKNIFICAIFIPVLY